MKKKQNLNKGQFFIELFCSLGLDISHALADIHIKQTTLYTTPVLPIPELLLQPVREIRHSVLTVPFSGDCFTGVFVGDEEGEDGEDDDSHDEG